MEEPIASLTVARLRQHYVQEGKTETEIAEMYSTYQVKVGRMRRAAGISTLVRTDRLGLPDKLTPRLRSILVGSMLGDGRLFETGSQTAGYSEYHSVEQKAYLDWKVQEWGPFGLRHKTTKGEYPGWTFTTHGCRTLHPFWRLFYPSGKGNKTFVGLPVEWVDALALAVWFMDDGSKTGRYFRLHVSPSLADRRVQLKALRRLGLKVADYEESNGNTLFLTNRTQVNRFLDLVRPHIHPSMSYKLEVQLSKGGPSPRDFLTSKRLQPLIDRGFSAQAMADVFRVSRGSVSRALDRMGAPRRPSGRPKKGTRRELDLESSKDAIRRLDPESSSFKDEAFKLLSQTELPLVIPTKEQALKDWRRIQAAPTRLEGNTIVKVSYGGSKLCQRFFQHRWDARYRKNPSAREAWYDPKYLMRAIQFQVGVGDPVVPKRVFRAVQAVVRAPTNFRPCFAKALVEALCPEGGLVLDPCAGYGGRAVGTLAAGRQYVGVDPHPQAGEAFMGLQTVTGCFTFHNEAFEDVDLGELKADLVLTSPPYFSVERYSDDTTQSWVRYGSWGAWVQGFLRPLVTKSKAHLRPGGVFCINTKNIKIGRQSYPIADELVRLAHEAGFELAQTLELPLGRLGKKPVTEPVLVFGLSGASAFPV